MVQIFQDPGFYGPGFSGSESMAKSQVLEAAQFYCVYFLTLKNKNCENKSKVCKVHKIHHYNAIK